MRHRLFLTRPLMVAVAFGLLFQGDVVPHGTYDDALLDIQNAESEQKRHQESINEYARLRDLYIGLANDLIGMYSGSLGTTRTILISALSSAYQGSIANTLGLGVRQMLNMHGSSSLQSMIDSAISSANTYQSMIDYLYDNPTKLPGYASANSAMEAYMDGCTAVAHFNTDHSSKQKNKPDEPIKKDPLGTLPTFECLGTCTNTYNTVWDALSDHHQKCGTANALPILLDYTSKQKVLEDRSVSDGCGVSWYSCDSDHSTEEAFHRVRTCNKYVAATRYINYTGSQEKYRSHHCGDSFRRCLPHESHHRWRTIKTDHDDNDPEGNDSSLSGKAYSESSSPIVSPDPPSTPTDGTPDCPDCTSHCSSPCSCTNSGTCNGTVTDNTPNCSDCTSHCSSPCSCSNSGTCNGTVSTPSPLSTPTLVACGGASYTGCSGASSRTAHHVPLCSKGCGNGYWTCDPNASRHTEVKTCKRSGCGASLTACQNGPNACVRAGKPSNWHWL